MAERKIKRTVFWKYDIDLEDYEEYFAEEGKSDADEYDKYMMASEINMDDFEDIRRQLRHNNESSDPIIVIADLGRWNGRFDGYRLINSGNLEECFSSEYEPEFYSDGYDLRCIERHHDGINHFLYRRIKKSISDYVQEKFLTAIYEGTYTWLDVLRCTTSLLPEVKKALGYA